MKSYTDISQSKKLIEILPIESADAFYFMGGKEPVDIAPIYGFVTHTHLKEQMAYKRAVPCWSLAALLSVLPYPHIEQNYKGKWTCRVELGNTTYLWEDSNPIDACVAMIEKLHELNLL